MAGQRYRLQRLLELRTREREACERRLSVQAKALQAAREALARAGHRLDALGRADGGVPQRTSLAQDWHHYSLEVAQAVKKLELARQHVTQVLEEFASSQASYAASRAREEALKKHRQRLRERDRLASQRAAQRELDEHAARGVSALALLRRATP